MMLGSTRTSQNGSQTRVGVSHQSNICATTKRPDDHRAKKLTGASNKIGSLENHQRNGQSQSRMQSEDAMRGFFQRPPAHLQESHNQPATVTKIPPTLENARSPDGNIRNTKSQSVTQKFHRDARDQLAQSKTTFHPNQKPE